MGLNSEIDEKDVWKIIENDEYLSQFLNSHSNNEIVDNSTVLAFSLSASEQLAALTKGINLLEKELQSQIFNNHHDLISQGKWVEKLEETLINMRSKVQELIASVISVRNKIVDPFDEIETQCKILTRLHDTSNFLRCIIQVQQLAKNLEKQDNLKASAMIKEVDEFCEDIDLSGINVLKNDLRFIEKEKNKIQTNARNLLNEALKEQNESQIAVNVQVFLNLNILNKEIKTIVDNAVIVVEKNTKSALNINSLMNQSADQEKISKLKSSGPGRITGNTFPGVNVAAFRSKLWSNWSNLLENIIYPKCAQVYILQYVIVKQHETILNSENNELEIDDYDITSKFWDEVSNILSRHLISASNDSSFIKQALEGEYPKLLRLHTDLNKKLHKITTKMPINVANISKFFHHKQFATQFENAYLSRSVSRLLDGVHSMFSGEGLPTQEEIDSFMRLVSNELSVSLVDEALCKTVIRNVGKAIRLFCIKSEQLIVTEGNASQVIDVPNASQQLNINIANTIYYMKQQIQKIVSNLLTNLPDSSKNEITKEYAHVDELVSGVVDLLKNSICEAIESIILTMHHENFKIETSVESSSCSLYLKELKEFIARAYSNYLKPFHHQQIMEKCCTYIAHRTIELFLRHVCLLRPIESGGRQKLSEDFKKIEEAISSLCGEIKVLGESYKVLRSFRPFITINDPKLIAENELLGKTIPHSLALMFLFSYAPSEIPSPHESCSWSVARLSQWLDNHTSEKDRLELISGALQRYQQIIKAQNRTSFHEIYPIMTNLLEVAFYQHTMNKK